VSDWLQPLRSGVFRRFSGNENLPVAKLGLDYQQHQLLLNDSSFPELPGFWSSVYRDQPR
jgi:hypothetical protein